MFISLGAHKEDAVVKGNMATNKITAKERQRKWDEGKSKPTTQSVQDILMTALTCLDKNFSRYLHRHVDDLQ